MEGGAKRHGLLIETFVQLLVLHEFLTLLQMSFFYPMDICSPLIHFKYSVLLFFRNKF